MPPTAKPLDVSTAKNQPVQFTLTGADRDNDPISYLIAALPKNGQLSGNAPDLTYTPEPGFCGTDNFSYRTHDGKLYSARANVTITVTNTAQRLMPDRIRSACLESRSF